MHALLEQALLHNASLERTVLLLRAVARSVMLELIALLLVQPLPQLVQNAMLEHIAALLVQHPL